MLPAFLYPTSHHVLLPCQLVWQEAEVGKLDTITHETSSWGSKKMWGIKRLEAYPTTETRQSLLEQFLRKFLQHIPQNCRQDSAIAIILHFNGGVDSHQAFDLANVATAVGELDLGRAARL